MLITSSRGIISNEVTIWWNEVTKGWNEVAWNEVVMERSDRNSEYSMGFEYINYYSTNGC